MWTIFSSSPTPARRRRSCGRGWPRELAARVAETPEDRHLRRQMFRVYQADIKTVDGFCASLLREHIHLLEPVDRAVSDAGLPCIGRG